MNRSNIAVTVNVNVDVLLLLLFGFVDVSEVKEELEKERFV